MTVSQQEINIRIHVDTLFKLFYRHWCRLVKDLPTLDGNDTCSASEIKKKEDVFKVKKKQPKHLSFGHLCFIAPFWQLHSLMAP